jgi:hypothetical protein
VKLDVHRPPLNQGGSWNYWIDEEDEIQNMKKPTLESSEWPFQGGPEMREGDSYPDSAERAPFSRSQVMTFS